MQIRHGVMQCRVSRARGLQTAQPPNRHQPPNVAKRNPYAHNTQPREHTGPLRLASEPAGQSSHDPQGGNRTPAKPGPARVQAVSRRPTRVLSVNIARAAPLALPDGGTVPSAIRKRPADGPVAVRLMGLQGDEQADPSVHGGVSKAVYAYPHTHYGFWQTVRAQAGVAAWGEVLAPGSLGENLTLEGLDETDLWVGDQLRLPHCLLAVSEPRLSCAKLNAALGFRHAEKLMAQSGYCGSYLVVLEAGTVSAGDAIQLLPGPREVNIRDLFRARVRPE